MIKEAIILAGGKGTRLRAVVEDLPKPMAKIGEKHFLEYLFEYLASYNVTHVVLSVGYMYDVIQNYFGNQYQSITIDYAIEQEPLGTGGAIKKALSMLKTDPVLVMNGDTFFDLNLHDFYNEYQACNDELGIAVKNIKNSDRYGTVTLKGKQIEQFHEKRMVQEAYINGGVYLLKRSIFNNISLPSRFSFEKEYLETYVGTKLFSAYISKSYFIDIGIPEDYQRAQIELPKLFKL